ncbi:carbohydrate-binding protein [Catenulispora pinisilvae]|uniref:carbohydrate-binding protein n=1 Tax=Catenulispora pinisilvae TaxID=2705253 RepID=UPI001892193A|nr:carbohydrate-binding protein [Catenulispora pinisilvae]
MLRPTLRSTPGHRRRRTLGLLTAAALASTTVAIWTIAQPASATSTTYEAENAALSGGAVVGGDHSGYTGSGFVEGYTDTDKGNADTTFTVTAGSAENETVALRYANGTGSQMSLSLYVNGTKLKQIPLPATADWNTWTTETETVSLNAGTDTISYKFDSSDLGNVNLDNITVAPLQAPPPGQYEAENAALSGGAVAGSDHSGYTGTGFVEGYTDTDKGNADTTFSVSASAAGSTTATLRYANGTGAQMSLSLYINGTKLKQIPLPATADWNTWTTESENVGLNAGSNTISYKFDSTDLGNVNLDNIVVAPITPPTSTPPTTATSSPSTPPPSGQAYEAETAFFSGGPSVATSIAGYSGSGYLTGFTSQGARTVIDAFVPAAGTSAVTLRYADAAGAAQTISLYVNGLKQQQLTLPAGSGWLTTTWNLALRSGENLIGFQNDAGDTGNIAVDDITVANGTAPAAVGATVPYTEYVASSAQTNGTVLAASRSYPSIQSESTGRQAVQLTATGQYVQITLTRPANSIVVRYSIPDNSDGSTATAPITLYANGNKVQDLSLTSEYSWLYGGGYTDTHSPANGPAHHFYDETRSLIGDWPAGTVLKLQKDTADTAASYTFDVIDTEQVDSAYSMPSGFASITDYGVTPNNGADDTTAINNALSALSGTGKGLWFPAGTYDISGRVTINGVPVRGAGEWYTTIQSTAVNGSGGLYTSGGVNQIADLTIDGDQTDRNNDSGAAGIEGTFQPGSLVFDVWMEHLKVGLWAVPADGLYATGLRIRDVFADGVHLHGGSADSRVDQSVVRNTGDDELALDTEGGDVTNCVLADNTVQSPIQANGIGVYGGSGNVVENNQVSDTVAFGAGITISTRFGAGFSGPTTVSGNVLTRAGSYNSGWGSSLGALWIYADLDDITQPVTVTDNTIDSATYEGVLLSYAKQISDLTVDHLTINGAGTYGINVNDVTGAMTADYVAVSGTGSAGLNNPGAGFTITRGPGDTGW